MPLIWNSVSFRSFGAAKTPIGNNPRTKQSVSKTANNFFFIV